MNNLSRSTEECDQKFMSAASAIFGEYSPYSEDHIPCGFCDIYRKREEIHSWYKPEDEEE